MAKMEPRSILLEAFPGIREGEADEMLTSSKTRVFENGYVICREGEIERTFYIILDGEVEVTKAIENEDVRVLTHLSAGDFFGEMAIIHDAPRAATITTVSPTTTVLEFHREAFAKMMEHSKSMSLALVREVSRRLRENDELAIAELREKARQLDSAYRQLANLEQARREFLTTIAHELRTPLMAASGFLQIIRMGGVQGEALNSALDTVSRNVQEIISLTNDILFVQEMDLILPEFQLTDVGAVVASAVEQQRMRAERSQVGISLNIGSGLPAVKAESKSLERAILAILDNAIKFSPEGGDVCVDVRAENNGSGVSVSIGDQGVGIPPEALPRIFDRFFHIDKMGKHLFRGAGLGLSIARQVIEQHQGVIEVQSEMGKGSVFTVRLKA